MKTVTKITLALVCALNFVPNNSQAFMKKAGMFLGAMGATTALGSICAWLYHKKTVKDELTKKEREDIRLAESEARYAKAMALKTKHDRLRAAQERLFNKRREKAQEAYNGLPTGKQVALGTTATVATIATACFLVCNPEGFFRTLGFLTCGGLSLGAFYVTGDMLEACERNPISRALAVLPVMTFGSIGILSGCLALGCVASDGSTAS